MNTTVENKNLVMRLTGLSEYQYNLMQFEVGLSFLQQECSNDETSIKIMTSSDLFWKWWKNIYQQRDQLWIDSGFKNLLTYKRWQNPKNINQYPNRFVYEKAYDEFFGSVRTNSNTTNDKTVGGKDSR